MYAIRESAKECGIDLKNTNVLIQGYGDAGYHSARLLSSILGCKVVTVSDSKGGIFSKEGIDSEKIGKYNAKTGSVANFPNTKSISLTKKS